MKVRGPRSSTKAEAWRGTWGGLVLGEVRVPSGPRNLRNRHRLGNRFQHSDRQTILPSTCPAASHGTWATLNICTTKTHAIRTSDLPAAVGRSRDASIIVPPSTIPTPTHPQFPFPSRCCLHVPVFTLGHTHTPSEPIHLSQCSTSPLLKSKSRPGVEAQIPLLPEAVTLLLFPLHPQSTARPMPETFLYQILAGSSAIKLCKPVLFGTPNPKSKPRLVACFRPKSESPFAPPKRLLNPGPGVQIAVLRNKTTLRAIRKLRHPSQPCSSPCPPKPPPFQCKTYGTRVLGKKSVRSK